MPAEEIDDAVEAVEIETFRRRLNLAPINAGPQIPHAEPGGRLRFEFLLPRRQRFGCEHTPNAKSPFRGR